MTSNGRSSWQWGVLGLALLVLGAAIYFRLTATPQVGNNDEVTRTLDALFTAVTGRNDAALLACKENLVRYRDEGQLPPAAAARIEATIQRAQGGEWDDAARDLYSFISAQRGER